jgi:alpha-glucosidase
MPPRWALGHQQSRFSYPDAAAMRAIANELREHEIPTDVLWFDGAYMDGYKLFTFDDEAFPNAPDLIEELHDMGYKRRADLRPGRSRFDESYPLYQEAVAQDHLLQFPDGTIYDGVVWGGREYAFPDYSSRATREWWSRHMSDFLVESGFDGIWEDMNEPVHYGVVRWVLPETLLTRGDERYRAGTFTEYNNVYALQQLDASEAAFREAYPERRPFILTRANYIGGQRHSATWTGDNTHSWDHLLWSIAMIQNLGISGQPFSGADIGGFFMPASNRETRNPELFAHWIGVGAFYPFCRNHSAGLDDSFTRTFGGGPTQHPWDFGPEIEQVYRQAVERRYRLLPYLYTLMRNAALEGALAIRPVFFAAPGEARLRAEDRAFLFGPDLLIVPHWPEGTIDNTSPLELPNGFDREITLVGEDPDVDVALPRIRIRNGAIVPTGVVGQTTELRPFVSARPLHQPRRERHRDRYALRGRGRRARVSGRRVPPHHPARRDRRRTGHRHARARQR